MKLHLHAILFFYERQNYLCVLSDPDISHMQTSHLDSIVIPIHPFSMLLIQVDYRGTIGTSPGLAVGHTLDRKVESLTRKKTAIDVL